MFYKVLMQKRANLEKVAVTLPELRRAYDAKVRPNLVRTPKETRKFFRRLAQANKGLTTADLIDEARSRTAMTVPKSWINSKTLEDADDFGFDTAIGMALKKVKSAYKGQLDPDEAGLQAQRGLAKIQDKIKSTADPTYAIIQGGDVGRTMAETGHVFGANIPKAKTPEAREAFNRAVGLHEAAEMTSGRHSPSRGPKPTFFSHQGVQPMLNDMNIANTFTGRGAKELKAQFHGMREDELSGLKSMLGTDPRSVALVEKLQAGGRINRHERKYLDRQYAKIELGR
jgi:hypothetical protein